MEEELVAIMKMVRECDQILRGWGEARKRIESYLKPAFINFAFSRPPNSILLTATDVALTSQWIEILSGAPVEPTSIEAAIATIPALCEAIVRRKTLQLLEVVRNSKTYSGRIEEVNADILLLASTIFRCKKCEDRINYPDIMVHICNFLSPSCQAGGFPSPLVPDNARVIEQVGRPDSWITRRPENLAEKVVVAAAKYGYDDGFWNDFCNIEFGDAEHDHVLKLLDLLKMDRRSLAEDLTMRQPYVEGLCPCFNPSSAKGTSPKQVIRWMKAVRRTFSLPDTTSTGLKLRVVTDVQSARAL